MSSLLAFCKSLGASHGKRKRQPPTPGRLVRYSDELDRLTTGSTVYCVREISR